MTIKVYISGICGSQEVRKQQQRVLFILQSLPIDLKIIDVTDPGQEEDLNFMQEEAKKHDKKTQLPPQIFNDDKYCGDYTDFALANDDDEIMRFLKLESGPSKIETLKQGNDIITENGLNHKEEPNMSENHTANGIHDTEETLNEVEQEDMATEKESNETNKSDVETPEADIKLDDANAETEASVKMDDEKKESTEESEAEESE